MSLQFTRGHLGHLRNSQKLYLTILVLKIQETLGLVGEFNTQMILFFILTVHDISSIKFVPVYL